MKSVCCVPMYSGITRGVFPVVKCKRPDGGVLEYEVELNDTLVAGIEPGASVAIDGVCQTAVEVKGTSVAFHAIDETLRVTTLDSLACGRMVSVERSLKIGDEHGGHDVFGHVKGVGTIVDIVEHGSSRSVTIECPKPWMAYLFEKGFVAIDGSSLTIGNTSAEGRFELHLIPETLRLTNLGARSVGDKVNVELDAKTVAIVETVERVLNERGLTGELSG